MLPRARVVTKDQQGGARHTINASKYRNFGKSLVYDSSSLPSLSASPYIRSISAINSSCTSLCKASAIEENMIVFAVVSYPLDRS